MMWPMNTAETRGCRGRVLMLLTNAFDPDPRVDREARVLQNAGFRVTILCWDRDRARPSREDQKGIFVERLYVRSTHGRGAGQILFLALFWLLAFIKGLRLGFDIVHCHDFDTLPLGYLLARIKRAALIYDAHESYADMLENVPLWMKRAIVHFEDFFLPRVDGLITVGEILEKHFQSRGARKTTVVGNWKDPAAFCFEEETLARERRLLGIPEGAFVISFIANLGYERQIVPLIEAVRDMPRVFLVLGGRGPAEEIVRTAAALHSNIVYLGFVPPARVPLYTAMSHAVFYGFDPTNANSRFSAPNKLFEAIAAGRAVICGDFGEIGRIVKQYRLGCVLPRYSVEGIREAVNKLSDEKVLKEILNNTAMAAKIYNGEEAAARLIAIYEDSFRIKHFRGKSLQSRRPA